MTQQGRAWIHHEAANCTLDDHTWNDVIRHLTGITRSRDVPDVTINTVWCNERNMTL